MCQFSVSTHLVNMKRAYCCIHSIWINWCYNLLTWGKKICTIRWTCSTRVGNWLNSNSLSNHIMSDLRILSVLISLPILLTSWEITHDRFWNWTHALLDLFQQAFGIKPTFHISTTELAIRGVAKTEALRTSKFVVSINVEMTNFAIVAPFAHDILLTKTISSSWITGRCVVQTSFRFTFATLTAVSVKVPMISFALIALISYNTGFAITFSLRCAL